MELAKEKILIIITHCIVSLNDSLTDEEQIPISQDSVLFGEGSSMDSMGLLNLLMDLEDQLADQGFETTILDDHALSQKHSPFKSITSLVDYIYRKIQNDI